MTAGPLCSHESESAPLAVHFASLLLTSMGTAAAELLVPSLYRWAVPEWQDPKHDPKSLCGRLLKMAFTVPTLFGEWHPLKDEKTNQAQRLVERALRNLIVVRRGVMAPQKNETVFFGFRRFQAVSVALFA